MPAIPVITQIPDPPLLGFDIEEDFSDKTDAVFGALPTVIDELNAAFPLVIAASAVANYSATSISSLTVGAGAKTLATQDGKMFVPGTPIIVADVAAPATNYMYGLVTAYDFATGTLSFASLYGEGAGTHSSWSITLTGLRGLGSNSLPALGGNAGKVLAVNAGGTGLEWVEDGLELITTLSPVASASESILSIPADYSDLRIHLSISTSVSSSLYMAISPDGVSWSATLDFGVANSPKTGGGVLFGYNASYGGMLLDVAQGASPSITAQAQRAGRWACTGGIRALRFTPSGGATMTGTISLFGKR